jgi:hypothetical protein
MTTYELHHSEHGDIETCCRCDSEAPTYFAERLSHPDMHKENLSGYVCRFCYETELGSILGFPRSQAPGVVELTRALAQALNLLDNKP